MRTRTAPDTRAADAPGEDRPLPGRAAAATATAFAATFALIARLVRIVGGLIFALIVAAIVLRDFKANPSNGIVKAIHDAANVFASPFTGMFHPHGARLAITINWGIAAIVYLVVAGIIAALVMAPARLRRRY